MNPASYHFVGAMLQEKCPICWEPLANNVIAHIEKKSSKRIHPIHRDCLQQWANQNPVCPMCRIDIDSDPLPCLKERIMKKLTLFTKTIKDLVCMDNPRPYRRERTVLETLSEKIAQFMMHALISLGIEESFARTERLRGFAVKLIIATSTLLLAIIGIAGARLGGAVVGAIYATAIGITLLAGFIFHQELVESREPLDMRYRRRLNF